MDVPGFLAAFLENRIRFGRENIDSFIFLLGEVQRNSAVREQWVDQVIHPTLAKIQSILQNGMDNGRYELMNPETVSRAIAGMAIGFMLLHSIEKEKSAINQSNPAQLAREMTNTIIYGIQRRSDGNE
jgi:hypothetical protein